MLALFYTYKANLAKVFRLEARSIHPSEASFSIHRHDFFFTISAMSSEPNTPNPAAPDSEAAPENATPESTTAPVASSPVTPVVEAPVAETPVAAGETVAQAATEAVAAPAIVAAPGAPDETAAKSKVAIGSQRDPADKSLTPSQPKAVQAAFANPISLTVKDEPIVEILADIKSDTGFSDDIDAEIEAAMSEVSMDEVVSNTQATHTEIEPNTRVKAAVTKIHEDNVFVKLEGQYEGIATLHHFKEAPAEGDLVEVIVRGLNKEDGLYELAVPGASIGVSDWEDITDGAVIDAVVTGSNTGGLEVTINSIRGFIPASQIDRFRVEDFSSYVGQKLTCVVVEVNPDKRKLVLSRRAILERENEEKRIELMKELEAGQIREGVVTKLMDFGAFVDLGGVEGLIHVSKISWSRVKHPSDILKVGENVKVKVEKVDAESNRISLSHRDTLEHPWTNLATQFSVEDIVKGTVTRIADFGAFVRIAPGVEGLCHISELAYQRVAKVGNVVSEGQEIEVKIQSMDIEGQKISLSHKACLTPPAPKAGKARAPEADEPARELAVQPSGGPLKGGTDRKSGGEGVGLKW
ncbi:MAG: putative RNA-binding protein with RPS1 domain [Mariniblastus sp.]